MKAEINNLYNNIQERLNDNLVKTTCFEKTIESENLVSKIFELLFNKIKEQKIAVNELTPATIMKMLLKEIGYIRLLEDSKRDYYCKGEEEQLYYCSTIRKKRSAANCISALLHIYLPLLKIKSYKKDNKNGI